MELRIPGQTASYTVQIVKPSEADFLIWGHSNKIHSKMMCGCREGVVLVKNSWRGHLFHIQVGSVCIKTDVTAP